MSGKSTATEGAKRRIAHVHEGFGRVDVRGSRQSKATGGESKVVAVTRGQSCWWRSVKWGGKAMGSQP